ncbi:PREDICTED: N-acetylated-alpha-linked acidic dipeptidase 2-like [Acropora digitifera]|uniref:N-acetylated-alpha-linked acidic dipeptidase 2-like n=1 Tax=Acropora digitifera TaxID=70779 RepID=UPI000779FBBA|nr:PREDICTED: N-acetylated-alpha-linked acidic dipeptidase 2-like [Acropora digitifera]
MFRRPVNESELPRIPAQAISYGDAMELLQRLGGEEAPESWQGGLSITYHVGPGFKNSSTKIKLEVNNQLQEKSIYNVVGTIVGRDEPHRYIIVGNHRDSWSFGAVDALSGTTVTNEIARLLGILLEKGWRPRRTIKICSWGGEEFNLIGSHEWVEENAHILTERAVAYINLDIAVCGDYVLRARTSPLFKQVTYKWARQVKNPQHLEANDTMYDIWLKRTPSDINSSEPRIFNLFSSSDYASFYQYLGIPSADFGYWFGYGSTTSLYPVYHTQQDTFYWVKKFVDQKFQVHKAMTQFSGGMLLDLADQPLLPFDIMNYAKALKYSFQVLNTSSHFSVNNISLSALQDAITGFLDTSKRFESKKSDPTEHKSTSRLRMLNDQMVKVEKAFIYPYGLPGKIQSRHVAFNYGFHNLKPGKATFPGVTEALHMAEISNDWNTARKQVSIATYSVQSANQVLKDPMK